MTEERRFYETAARLARGGRRLRRTQPRADRRSTARVVPDARPGARNRQRHRRARGRFRGAFPNLDWQPSDIHPEALPSIAAWRDGPALPNLRASDNLDAASPDWPIERADVLLSINMVHISPWASALGLIDGAARLLPAGGPLILYGPWLGDAIETAPSNLAFDADLKRRDPEWGLRRVRGHSLKPRVNAGSASIAAGHAG